MSGKRGQGKKEDRRTDDENNETYLFIASMSLSNYISNLFIDPANWGCWIRSGDGPTYCSFCMKWFWLEPAFSDGINPLSITNTVAILPRSSGSTILDQGANENLNDESKFIYYEESKLIFLCGIPKGQPFKISCEIISEYDGRTLQDNWWKSAENRCWKLIVSMFGLSLLTWEKEKGKKNSCQRHARARWKQDYRYVISMVFL